MKVFLDAQYPTFKNHFGIKVYSIELIKNLLERRAYTYELFYFDKGKEMGNKAILDTYFSKYNVPYNECNSISYRDILRGKDVFAEKSFNELTGIKSGIFHFMSIHGMPDKIDGKAVITIHDIIPITSPGEMLSADIEIFSKYWDTVKRERPVIITDSNYAKQDMLNIAPQLEGNIFTVYCGKNEKDYFYEPSPLVLAEMKINGDFILNIGHDKRKNWEGVVDAFNAVAAKNKDLQLVIVGIALDSNKYARDKINESPYRERIICKKSVSDAQLRALYSGASVFVFPSYCEGFGLPVLEAMACGCPVITSNTTSLPEVAGDAGILINPHDTGEISYQMQRVLESKKLQDELRKKGFRQAEKFSWEKTAIETEKIYHYAHER